MSRRDKAPDITCLACEVASCSVEVRVKEVRKIIRDRAAEANALFELLMPNISSEVYKGLDWDQSQLDELGHGRILALNATGLYDLDAHLGYRDNIHRIFADIGSLELLFWRFCGFFSGHKMVGKNCKIFVFINPESEAERAQVHKLVGLDPEKRLVIFEHLLQLVREGEQAFEKNIEQEHQAIEGDTDFAEAAAQE
ncbi:hypothetical protein GTA08_BOTSDO04947 [Botryosphaeria dothidea]|uniref:Uncharacterized protein n=1 Tax=Botryosphaeria dothidea TaxID=55169 RepID=A0A8H4N8U5_9PEZI|nr:hypothetical protein GTA08_BOTSDO04947 [Botryosphaeria dothidea]